MKTIRFNMYLALCAFLSTLMISCNATDGNSSITGEPTTEDGNELSFTYQPLEGGNASTLWKKIQNKLGNFNEVQNESVKIASSDEDGAASRAVVFSCNLGATKPDLTNLSDEWDFMQITTSDGYTQMYENAADSLNSDKLTAAQAYTARMCMTNSKDHNSYLTIFYRKEK